ncbi:amidohydrolase family protein [Maribellus sp. CM-23]|uniref:amidohydrolase family protein n=1 Tax=Maribellus sp. CM-23 TaxID=2781026 RepID=UPI001F3255B6|nr:amidohydrolase family protein [Maribellus sp. CM-23]MCE4566968.1 amidohydrolase family protein [Maribellus sp. CM-23]
MVIDTHHHFWNYNPVEFAWIDDEMAAIRKNFLPEDLASTIQNSGVDGVVTVQARQCLEETEWLLQLASENEFIKGVVGWLPLADKNIQTILDKYHGNRWLKGVRHVVQGEPDPEFILGEAFNQGVSQLKVYGLVYDILILEHQLANTIRFVDRHPDQLFVLDHIAKPKIKTNEIQPWHKLLKELAKRENVSCKISGMVTEADYQHWTEAQLQPYFDAVFNAFGPARLLFGSDWPVCQVATNYSAWLQLVKKQVSKLSSEEQNQIFYHNALKAYHL